MWTMPPFAQYTAQPAAAIAVAAAAVALPTVAVAAAAEPFIAAESFAVA